MIFAVISLVFLFSLLEEVGAKTYTDWRNCIFFVEGRGFELCLCLKSSGLKSELSLELDAS